jgi:hypothetical protein
MEIEDANFLRMSHSVVANMGRVMVSSEWTVEEADLSARFGFLLIDR